MRLMPPNRREADACTGQAPSRPLGDRLRRSLWLIHSNVAITKALDDVINFRSVQDFPLKQNLSHLMQHGEARTQKLLGPLVRIHDDTADLSINLDGGLLRIVLHLGKIAPQKDLFLFFAESHGTKTIAHPPLTHHATR